MIYVIIFLCAVIFIGAIAGYIIVSIQRRKIDELKDQTYDLEASVENATARIAQQEIERAQEAVSEIYKAVDNSGGADLVSRVRRGRKK
jgi:hypothetical protein